MARKRKRNSRKSGARAMHMHRAHFGEIRQCEQTQKWRGFNLQRGMYFGEDESGFWATYGYPHYDKSGKYDGLLIFRAERNGFIIPDSEVSGSVVRVSENDEIHVWEKSIEDSPLTRNIYRKAVTQNGYKRDNADRILLRDDPHTAKYVPNALKDTKQYAQLKKAQRREEIALVKSRLEEPFKAASEQCIHHAGVHHAQDKPFYSEYRINEEAFKAEV